jgi:hypothetical protein
VFAAGLIPFFLRAYPAERMDKTKKGLLLSSTASSTHNKRFVASSSTTAASSSAPSMASSSSAAASSQSILTSMRRHLPKATHGHLDTLSEWSRFRTAKKFEREQQHHHHHQYGRMGASGGSGGPSSGNVFKVQVPAKLMLVALAVFLVVPVSIFGWKETHWKVQKEKEDLHHHHHIRGGVAKDSSSYDPQWMEHNLYKKEPEQQEKQQPEPPSAVSPAAEEAEEGAAATAAEGADAGEPTFAADATLDASKEGGTSISNIDGAGTNSTGSDVVEPPPTTGGEILTAEAAGHEVAAAAGVSDVPATDAVTGEGLGNEEEEKESRAASGNGEEAPAENGMAQRPNPPGPT